MNTDEIKAIIIQLLNDQVERQEDAAWYASDRKDANKVAVFESQANIYKGIIADLTTGKIALSINK